MIFQKMVSQGESFTLLAVPFFVAVGVIMNYSGIATRLMNVADMITGRMVGGLAQSNVVLSALMGGVSGSANADAAMEAKMLVPEMTKRGYSKGFSAGVTAASAVLTPIIPLGICLILYGSLTNGLHRHTYPQDAAEGMPKNTAGRILGAADSLWHRHGPAHG